MIQGFEELTEPISEREAAEFLPPILEGLKTKVGRQKAVTNKAIVAGLRQNRGIRISEARVRTIINHIRCNDLVPCLVATSEGYYIAETEQELLDYETSLEGRERAINEVRESIRRQRMAKYHRKSCQMTMTLI